MSESASWSVAGESVEAEWDTVTMTAPGGYGSLSITVPASQLPAGTGPFTPVHATRESGRVLFWGETSSPPRIYRGRAVLELQGYQGRLTRSRGRRLYQSQDVQEWVAGDSDPHNKSMNDSIDVNVGDGRIAFIIHSETFANNDRGLALFWAPGETITRLAFDVDRNNGLGNFGVNFQTGVGPSGTITSEGTYNLAGTSTVSIDRTLTNPDSMVGIQVAANAATSPNRTRVRISNLRVNGRATGDTFTLADLSADLASELGWDSLQASDSGNSVLPLDWIEGWDSELDNVAESEDCTWLAIEPGMGSTNAAGLYIGSWGRHEWRCADEHGANFENLQQLLPYNRAEVSYETAKGVLKTVTADADPDPYGGLVGTVVWPPEGPYALFGKHKASTRADSTAALLVAYYSQPRVRGQIQLGALIGGGHAWDVEAGDLLTLADYRLADGTTVGPQRVTAVERRANGTATATVGADISLSKLLRLSR
jgi:hypothetical protein